MKLAPWNFPISGSRTAHWRAHGHAAASVAAHAALLAAAFFFAFFIRFDFSLNTGVPGAASAVSWVPRYFLPLLPAVVGLKLLVFVVLRVHRSRWRYISLPDLGTLFIASTLSLACLWTGLFIAQYGLHSQTTRDVLTGLPETIFLLDWLFGILFVVGARVLARLIHEDSRSLSRGIHGATGGATRLLVIGAGDAAETVIRELARTPEQRYRIVGLLDDSPAKQRTRLHGIPVLGTIDDLPVVAAKHHVGEVLIALPSASKTLMQRIITLCRATHVSSTGQTKGGTEAGGAAGAPLRFRTVPSLADLITSRAAVQQIRDVSVNDILGRDAVETDLAAVGALLHQQVVVVSGAGGSIGSEICRTVAHFSPATLVLLDKAENAIFEIERELRRSFPTVRLAAAIGDISDPIRVEQIFAEHQPAMVFHAAAHKHVPLAETNPGEAIRNNVFGTKTLADTAARFGTKNFVMISTDKAVNPTSIMGATKRCAEIYIQSLARRCATNFITVRFGNVLGSNGSVVPIFQQQIAAGGPLTVTHPEMRRYFMTIPEASQLVLQAGALGQRGEIFVLDMGQPVRILDLARDLILLSGLRPEIDIPIVFTGLRPGEKLFEELSIRGEDMLATRHPKIAIWKSTPAPGPALHQMLDDLEPLQHCTDRTQILAALTRHIPEMRPWMPERPAPAEHIFEPRA